MSLYDMTREAFDGPDTTVEPGWGQGRSTFGGVLGALLVARMRGILTQPRPLRSVTLHLAAPVVPGPVRLDATVLREGRSVTLVQADLRQGDAVAASAQAVFGASRPSSITLPAPGHPAADDVAGAGGTGQAGQAGRALPARPRLRPPRPLPLDALPPGTPEFFAQVELDFVTGHVPFSGAARPDFGGWMRFRDRVPALEAEHLVALVDVWPPAMTPMLVGPTPVSTVAWTLELLVEEFSGEDFWQYDVQTDACRDGYGHTGARVWNAAGELAAISRQTVTVFG